ncbi:MAG: GNAT family N-acetyltransferase [Erythrobacter sp.]|nr:GNAT family N-acetyltransferase [Erythrobacter sp.]
MPDIVLETERLVLRTIGEGDAETQFRVLNTPMVMRHLGGSLELHEIEAKHAKTAQLHAREGFSFLFAIEKASGDLIGQCGLKRVDSEGAKNSGNMEIGWLVREDRWRQGFAREMVESVLDWAFTRHAAPHVVALTSEGNVPSWRLMERIGMRRRTDLDFDDSRFPPDENPTILYSLSHEEWRSRA